MDAALLAPKLTDAERRMISTDRKVRMREKLSRMPTGTFTFAPGLDGREKFIVHEILVDECLRLFAAEKAGHPTAPRSRITTDGPAVTLWDGQGQFMARFTRDWL